MASRPTPMPEWCTKALEDATSTPEFESFVSQIHLGVAAQLQELSVGKRFAQLTPGEQAALVERTFLEMQQQDETYQLTSFATRLGRAVDDQLVQLLMEYSTKGQTPFGGGTGSGSATDTGGKEVRSPREPKGIMHPSNVDRLLGVCSDALMGMIAASPPELMAAVKLFLNRPLPLALRSHVWDASLKSRGKELDDATFGRLAPSLDVLMARRAHSLLDFNFPELSTRSNASTLKAVTTNVLRMLGLKMPLNADDNFAEADLIAMLAVPLLVVMRADHQIKSPRAGVSESHEFTETYSAGCDKEAGPFYVENCLFSLLEPRHLGLLSVNSQTFVLADRAAGLTRLVTILSTKNPTLYTKLARLKPPDTLPGERDREPAPGDPLATQRGLGPADPLKTEATTFDDFLGEQMLRGLSGILPLETLLFVWDQGFIATFGALLPAVTAALVLGAGDELRGLSTLQSVFDVFVSYCKSVDVPHLQM